MPPKQGKAKTKRTENSQRPSRKRSVPTRYTVTDSESDSDTSQSPPQKRSQPTSTNTPSPAIASTSTTPDAMIEQIANMQALMVQQQQCFTDSLNTLQQSIHMIVKHLPTQQQAPTPTQNTVSTLAMPGATATPSTGTDQQTATAQQNSLTPPTIGESLSLGITTATPQRQVQVAGTPIGQNIKQLLKEKIWAHTFIDLAELLYPNHVHSYSLSIQNHSTDQPSFNLAPKRRKHLSEAEWGRAMDAYVAVYTQKYQTEIAAILTYCQQVKELMAMGANWQYFDEKYRSDREFTKCSWLDFRPDLESRALIKTYSGNASEKNHQRKQNQPFRAQHNIPPGYCFAYHNKTSRCESDKCSYKHTCKDCGRQHPMFLSCFTNDRHKNRQPDNNSRTRNYRPSSKPRQRTPTK